jgi:hypothetical protein
MRANEEKLLQSQVGQLEICGENNSRCYVSLFRYLRDFGRHASRGSYVGLVLSSRHVSSRTEERGKIADSMLRCSIVSAIQTEEFFKRSIESSDLLRIRCFYLLDSEEHLNRRTWEKIHGIIQRPDSSFDCRLDASIWYSIVIA